MNAILPATLAGADLLRQIRDRFEDTRGVPSLDDIAGLNPDTRRDILKRSLERLIQAGNVQGGPEGYGLTEAGNRALLGLDVADGVVTLETAGEAPRALPDRFRPNPDQPRRDITDDMVRARADTIEAEGDVLANLEVYPPDAHGVRMIADGEVRWRAVQLLVREGRCPPVLLERGLKYEERPYVDGDPEFVALVANTGAPLSELDEAEAMLALATKRKWSARELARKTGRCIESDKETGIRLVQQRIRVAREATAEAKAAFRAGDMTWEALRRTVETPKDDGPTPKQACAIVELLDRLERLEANRAPVDTDLLKRKTDFNLVAAGYVMIVTHQGRTEIEATQKARDWRAGQGQAEGADKPRALLALRAQAWGEATAFRCDREDLYATPWLNVSDDPLVVGNVRFYNASLAGEARRLLRGEGGAGSPAKTKAPAEAEAADATAAEAGPSLTPLQTLLMAEIGHALGESGRWSDRFQCRVIPATNVWLDAEFAALKNLRLVDAGIEQKGEGWVARLLPPGEAWLSLQPWYPASRGSLAVLRTKAGLAGGGGGYTAAWLNGAKAAPPVDPPASPVAPPQAEAAAEPEHDAGDLAEAQHARIAIDQALAGRRILSGFGDLLETAQLRGPFSPGAGSKYLIGYVIDAQGNLAIRVDEGDDLPDDLVIAQTQVIAAALNAAGGYGPPIMTVSSSDDGENALARSVRAAMDWMLRYYVELQAVPGAEAVYRDLSQALNAEGWQRQQAAATAEAPAP